MQEREIYRKRSVDFENALSKEKRQKNGVHYTSRQNIHRLIDPMFLFSWQKMAKEAIENKDVALGEEVLGKIYSSIFFDPACGTGNFLMEIYLSLKELVRELKALVPNAIDPKFSQFLGFEIDPSSAKMARESLRGEAFVGGVARDGCELNGDDGEAKILQCNALREDWLSFILENTKDNIYNYANTSIYIIGNPPFLGHQKMDAEKKEDMKIVFEGSRKGKFGKFAKLDYCAAWFMKSADLMDAMWRKNELCGSRAKVLTAFVATNSIVQGESVGQLWKCICEDMGQEIFFANKNFVWSGQSEEEAQVDCVIIGFSKEKMDSKYIFHKEKCQKVEYISPFLSQSPNIFIKNRHINRSLPKMSKGSQPTDGGNLLLEASEKEVLCAKYPILEKYIKPYVGAHELIWSKKRFCLWFDPKIDPKFDPKTKPKKELEDVCKIEEIASRLEAVRNFRGKSPTKSVREAAKTPMLFTQIRHRAKTCIVIPETTSSAREYIPIAFLDSNCIAANSLQVIDSDDIFLFGLLNSRLHHIFVRHFSGRFRNGYRYTPAVYNNFPYIDFFCLNRERIEKTANQILGARNLYSNKTLAELYSKNMPMELKMAHKENDRAVFESYFGSDFEVAAGWGSYDALSDEFILNELVKLYKGE